jgi:hypothetical protein
VGAAVVPEPARDLIARRTHERYAATVPHARPWNDLSTEEQAGSRAFVDDIPRKLMTVGRRLVRDDPEPTADGFTAEEVELLSRGEHERWVNENRSQSSSDDPDLVPWSELPEDRREIDRALVRSLPELVAAAGFRIVRVAR